MRRPPYARLARELWSYVTYFPPPPDPATLPQGGGHVVLVVPAYLNGEGKSWFRHFLERCGYRPLGWGGGVNFGPTARALAALRESLTRACALEGGPVSVVGFSLGGLLARDLAYDRPAEIRRVVTIASPFRMPTASTVAPLLRLSLRFFSPDIDVARLATPLPVPSTAIFTRDDGIVAWESCRVAADSAAAIEVSGAHITMSRNPATLRAVALSLGQGAG